MSGNIILLDMDGTITPPRKHISGEMCDVLERVLSENVDVGIITGSDMNFIKEQCSELFKRNLHKSMYFWPCNGSSHYKWDHSFNDLKLVYHTDMRDLIGERDFSSLIYSINKVHYETLNVIEALNIPMTGGFINFRGSSINYCPIGRDFNEKGRGLFEQHPKNQLLRKEIINSIRDYFILSTNGRGSWLVEFALGGKISVDIYPKGHNKSQVLGKIDKTPWFVGDNVGSDGNDKEIFKILVESNRGFKTSGPEETVEIISTILERIKSDG